MHVRGAVVADRGGRARPPEGGPTSQPGARRRDTGHPGANGWHRRQTGTAGSNPGSSLATFGGGWNGGTKSLVTCTYSGGHGRWSARGHPSVRHGWPQDPTIDVNTSANHYARDGAAHRDLAHRPAGAVRQERAHALSGAGSADRGVHRGVWICESDPRRFHGRDHCRPRSPPGRPQVGSWRRFRWWCWATSARFNGGRTSSRITSSRSMPGGTMSCCGSHWSRSARMDSTCRWWGSPTRNSS